MEIIIADDGSPEPASDVVDHEEFPWPVRICRMPSKINALNPCTPINRGVEMAAGQIIVLTNPEVVHKTPILRGMREELAKLGKRGYLAAACWSPDKGWWYCHSTLGPPEKNVGRGALPKEAGLHFCSMIRKSFYDEVGGFSEEYRDGQAYEDNDFLWKLNQAGANFAIADDLVTEHRDAPRTIWPQGGAARNRRIFEARWGT